MAPLLCGLLVLDQAMRHTEPPPTGPYITAIKVVIPAGRRSGDVVVTIGGQERVVGSGALRAWRVAGGRMAVYASMDGAGGYEDEGEGLTVYDVAKNHCELVMREMYRVIRVDESRAWSGRLVLFVTMDDGGVGATHVGIVDPMRGQVFRQPYARFDRIERGRVVIAGVPNPDRSEGPPPRYRAYDLDDLLGRSLVVIPPPSG